MELKKLVDIVDEAYPDGLVGLYFQGPEGKHGDTLAKFIASELKDTFNAEATDKEQLTTAAHQMRIACQELQGVVDALEAAMEGEHAPPTGG